MKGMREFLPGTQKSVHSENHKVIKGKGSKKESKECRHEQSRWN